jgi:hypothetical protein
MSGEACPGFRFTQSGLRLLVALLLSHVIVAQSAGRPAMTDVTADSNIDITADSNNAPPKPDAHGTLFRAATQFVELLDKTEKLSNRPSAGLLVQVGLGLLVVIIVARLLPFSKYAIQDFAGFDFLITFVVSILVVIVGAGLRFYDTMLSERRLEKIIDFQLEILRIDRGISEAAAKQTYQDQKNTIGDLLKVVIADRANKPV